MQGLHECGFVATSVHRSVRPGDQAVGSASFFLDDLRERQIDTRTIFGLHGNHIQVAAGDVDVGRNVVEGRSFRVLNRDDLGVLGHVAGVVCGGPCAVDLELRVAQSLNDLLEELD